MTGLEDLRRCALALPGASEGLYRGGPAFRVGRRKFALWRIADQRAVLKLDAGLQVMRFAVRPEIFQPLRIGLGTWSHVELGCLDAGELAALTAEAWATVAPRRISRRVLAEAVSG